MDASGRGGRTTQQPTTLSGVLGQRDREREQNPVPQTLRLAADATKDADPTRAARVLRVQGKTAWPTDFVERNLEVLEVEVEKPDFDADRFWRESPAIAAWVAQDPTRLAATRGRDLERMGRVEGYLKAIGTEFERNSITTDLLEPGLAAMMGRATPEQEASIRRLRERQQALPDVLGTRGFFAGIPIAAIGQLPVTLELYKSGAVGGAVGAGAMAGTAAIAGQLGPQIAIPEELATVPAAAARGFFLGSRVGVAVKGIQLEAVNAFLDYREMDGVDRETAAAGALIAGTMAGVLELLPFENAAKAIPGLRRLGKDGVRELLMAPTTRRLIQRYAGQVLTQMGTEGLTEGLQELVQVAGGVLTQRYAEGTLGMLSTETILREIFSSENLSRIGAAARTGAQSGAGFGAATGGVSTAVDYPAVRRAELNAQRMEKAAEAIHGNDREEAVTMAKDAPDAMKQAVASVGSEGVYYDISEFTGYWQSQTKPDGEAANPRDVAIALGVTPEAYDAALESGAPINIPTQNLLVDALATASHLQWFVDNMRVTPNELSRAEAMRQKEQASQPMAETAEGVAQMPTREQEAEQGVADLRDRLTAQLRQARVGPEESQASVALWTEAAKTAIARNPDLPVAEVLRRFERVQVVAQPVAAYPDGKAVSRFEVTGETMDRGDGTQVPVLKATRTARANAARMETLAAEKGEARLTERQREQLAAARQSLADAEAVNKTLTPVDFAALRGPVDVQGLTPEQRASVNVEANADELMQAATNGEPVTAQERADFLAQEQTLPDTLDVDGTMRPTRNSNGQPIHPTEEGVRNFWRWATEGGRQPLTDANGLPELQFHSGTFDETVDPVPMVGREGFHVGTEAAAQARQVGKPVDDFIREAELTQDEETGRWFWSSQGVDSFDFDEDGFASEQEARRDLESSAQEFVGNEIDFQEQPVTQVYVRVRKQLRTKDAGGDWSEVAANAKADGYDGISYVNQFEDKGSISYIVFDGRDMKSLGNSGEFGPTPNILRQGGMEPPVAEGFVRMWHAGVPYAGGKRWLSSSREYAEGYARKNGVPLQYVDVPRTHPEFQAEYEGQTIEAGFTVNAEFDESVVSGLQMVPQQGGMEPRGAFIAPAGRVDGPRLVALFKERNQSTFLHETAHAFLDLWTDLAADPAASPEFRELVNGVRAELGATEGERLSVAQEEQFAGLFLDYAKSGKAPSVSLRQAFASFAAFLTKLWSFVKGEIVPANENVRDLLDRLLATEDAIAEARGEFMAPLFPEDATINAAFVAARTEAEERTRTEAMRAVVRAEQEWWKRTEKQVAEEVRERVYQDRDYIARQVLTTGRMPDGSPITGSPLLAKLDRAQVVAIIGEDATKALPRGKTGAVYNTQGQGLDLRVAAEALGYENGPALLAALQQTQPIEEHIAQVTKATMTERYGDALTDGTVPQVAVEALHNDSLDRMRQLEMEAILRDHPEAFRDAMVRAASRPVNVREQKAWAKEQLANRPLNTIRPAEYLSAERKAGREAIRAVAAGEWAKAVQAKAKQRAASALYAEAVAVKEDVAKFQELVAKVFGPDERIAKSRNLDIVMAARQVLASVGIGRREEDTQFYLAQLAEYDPETSAALQRVVADIGVLPRDDFKALSVAEYIAVKDGVTELWTAAKQAETMHIAGKAYKKAEVKADLMAVLSAMPDSAVEGAGVERVATFRDKANRTFLAMGALLRRVESWVDLMDGGNVNGPFRRGIFQTIRDRTAEKSVAATADLTQYRDLLEGIRPTLTTADIAAPELGRQWVFKGKAHLLGTLLHTGNPSNMAMLLGGRGWTMDGWLRFRDRMVAEGVLTPADFEFIQQVWNLFEAKKPEAQKVHKRMFGTYFDEITRERFTITFPDGTERTYAGGYTPASKDPDASTKADQRAADSLLEEAFGMRFPSVQRGFTMSRVQNFEPLLLSLDIVPKHLDAVNKFIYLAEPVREVGRLLRDKELRAEMDRVNPAIVNDLLMPWLQRASTQMVQTPTPSKLAAKYFDPIAKYLRTTAGAGYMFLNVGNTLEQATGLSVAAVRVNPKFLTMAEAAILRNREGVQDVIDQHSPFMRERVATQLLEVSKRIEAITTNPSVAQRAQSFMAEHAYVLQSVAQNMVDSVVWYGSYLESVDAGLSVEDARIKADADVRLTQGSFDAVDVSRAETGSPWVRLFTMFASYFNMLANLNATEMQKAIDQMGLKKSMPRMFAVYALGFAVPILGSNLIRRSLLGRAAFGDFDGEDEWGYLDDFLRWFFGQQLSATAAMVPVAGQLPMAAANFWDDKTFNDQLTLSPAFSFVESSMRGTKASYDILFGDGMQRRDIRDVLSLFTLMSRIPATGLARPLTYLYDVEEGRAEPSGPVDFTRGLLSGAPGR